MTEWISQVVAGQDTDAPAIMSAEQSYSGRDLLGQAAAQTTWLDGLALAPATAVPALLEACGDALALVVAGAAAGHPLALLGPRMTVRELAACVQRFSSPVLVAQPAFLEIAQAVAAQCGKSVALLSSRSPSAAPLRRPPSSDAAMILHTSGTTGSPKPVSYRHGPLARRVQVNARLQQFDHSAVFATASPFHHIAGIGNIAVALGAGACVVSMPRFSVQTWPALADLGVTHALAVPTMIEMLLREDALALPGLKVLQYGAAPIHPDTLRRAMAALPGIDFLSLYGQTEGSPITWLSPDDHRAAANGREELLRSVGRAAPGVELRIEGADGRGVGEVTARAAHLFMSSDDGWLRTGDIGHLDDDRYLYLVGRRGDKIIRGGENVYPVEVENILLEHPDVVDAAVIGYPDQVLGEIVMAFVVGADPSSPPDPEELKVFARRSLAGYKVPAEWRFVEELPRNATGKLLRRSLLPTANAEVS